MRDRTKLELGIDISLFLILAFLAYLIPYFSIDLSFTRTLQQVELPAFSSLMILLSYIGEPNIFPFIVFLTAIVFFIMSKRRQAIFILISFLGGSLLAEFFKLLVHRVRPNPFLIHQFLPENLPDSFPSGHVMFYLSFFGFLIFLSRKIKDKSLRSFAVAVSVLLILLIGLSRIYLGEHWLSDVLGSYLLGIAWLYFVIRAYAN